MRQYGFDRLLIDFDISPERRQLDDLVGDATTDQRADPKKEPLIPSTMGCRVDEQPKARRHGGQL
jgi:hypothetical protein